MKKLFCILFFLLPLFLQAQQTNIDSLVNVLETQKSTIKEQLLLYEQICHIYKNQDPEKGILYGKKGVKLAEKNNDKEMIARIGIQLANSFSQKSYIDSSLLLLNRIIDISTDLNDKIKADAISETGLAYALQQKYQEAIEYYLECLHLYSGIDDKFNYARILINISGVYGNLNQKEQSFRFLKQAQAYTDEMNNPKLKIAVYQLLGAYYLNTNDYKNALDNMLIAYNLSHQYHQISYIMVTTQYLAGIYSDGFHDYEQAEKYALECTKTAESINSKNWMNIAYTILAKVYVDSQKFNEGKDIALKAWSIDSTLTNTSNSSAYFLGICYMYLHEHEKALYYFEKQQSLQKEQSEKQFLESLSNMEVKYETEKKEMRIATLEKERKLHIGLGITVAATLLLGMGLLFYHHRSKRKLAEQQIKQLEQEKELIATRSALDAEKAEREIIARDLHDGVGAMLSVVKNNMNIMRSHSIIENKEVDHFNKALDGLDKSIVELRRVAHHIMPAILMEKGLFAALDDFCRSIPEAEFHYTEPERRFDSEKELVLYRCAYELVNNALRHAKAASIEVHLNMDDETAYLSVVDNGYGFDPQTSPQGMGIKNLRTRLAAFGGSIEIYSETGKGTEANVELKI